MTPRPGSGCAWRTRRADRGRADEPPGLIDPRVPATPRARVGGLAVRADRARSRRRLGDPCRDRRVGGPPRAPAVADRGAPDGRAHRPAGRRRRGIPRGTRHHRARPDEQYQHLRRGGEPADPHQEPGDAAATARGAGHVLDDEGIDPEAELRARLLLYRAFRDAGGRCTRSRSNGSACSGASPPRRSRRGSPVRPRPHPTPPLDPAILVRALDGLVRCCPARAAAGDRAPLDHACPARLDHPAGLRGAPEPRGVGPAPRRPRPRRRRGDVPRDARAHEAPRGGRRAGGAVRPDQRPAARRPTSAALPPASRPDVEAGPRRVRWTPSA